jgi:exonuclease I
MPSEILAGITTGITHAAKRLSRPATTLKQPRRSSSHDAQAATTLKPLSTIKFEEEPVWFVVYRRFFDGFAHGWMASNLRAVVDCHRRGVRGRRQGVVDAVTSRPPAAPPERAPLRED